MLIIMLVLLFIQMRMSMLMLIAIAAVDFNANTNANANTDTRLHARAHGHAHVRAHAHTHIIANADINCMGIKRFFYNHHRDSSLVCGIRVFCLALFIFTSNAGTGVPLASKKRSTILYL